MVLRGQLHAAATLTRETTPVPTEQEARQAPTTGLDGFRKGKNLLPLLKLWTPHHPARS